MHRINLHGPWNLSISGIDAQVEDRLHYPCPVTSDLMSQGDRILLTRKFHAPTGLGADQQVFLKFRFNLAPSAIEFNGNVLHPETRLEWRLEVGASLASFNQITIGFDVGKPAKKFTGDLLTQAEMEIR